MNSHLSSDQIHGLVIGDANQVEEQHARECDECSAELTRLKETLWLFRDSVQHWSQQTQAAVAQHPEFVRTSSSRFRIRPLRWVFAAGVLVILIALPAYKNVSDRHREAQAAEDALLLERVNADLSRAVPASMERFIVLLVDDSAKQGGGRQ
jgi:hypothetical protein